MSSREVAVLATLVAYNLVLVAIGFFAERRTKDGADFFLGGRRLGPVVASLSASASSSSAWTLLGVSGMAYQTGLAALWLFPACVGGFCLNWYLLAPALQRHSRRSGALTTTEVLAGGQGRAGAAAITKLASLILLVSILTYVAAQFQGAGKSFSEAFGMSDRASILLGGAVVLAYTMLGGFWAVSLTDTLQGLVMAGTAVVLPLGAFLTLGPTAFAEGLGGLGPDYLSLFGRHAGVAAGAGFAAGLLGIGLGYPGQPHVVNRFMALAGGRGEVATARRVAVGWAVVVYAGMILLGLSARLLFPGVEAEKAFLVAAGALFPPVLSGVMIAAVLSAVMSTADSQLLVAASTLTYDLGVGGRDAAGLLGRSRLVVLVLSAASVVAALAGEASIFDKVLFAWASMGCAFGPLLLVTSLRGPVSPGGTIASMLSGFSLSVGAFYLGALLGPWSGAAQRVLPFLVALAVALGCSRRPEAAPDGPR